tara:strand:- start:335 stop:913 length:579 start_codon:yes stop_codon:yes gene_type:complete
MKNISSLSNIHKIGIYGDHYKKEESNLIKIKEIKNISLYQIVKYKNSKQDISDFKIHGVNFPVSLKTSSNQSTRILWMGPDNWYVFSTLDIFEDLNAFDDKDFAITNISQSRTVIELEGDSINEVLKKGTPLNVDKLKSGDCANTVYNGITITLDFISNNPNKLRIFGLRSFGESLYHSITDASLEYGYKSI